MVFKFPDDDFYNTINIYEKNDGKKHVFEFILDIDPYSFIEQY